MGRPTKSRPELGEARQRLIDAARHLIRARGYAATSVDDLCSAAGVTKGAFFHHFRTKEALGVAVARDWDESVSTLFAGAPYHEVEDPRDRVLAYVELRKAMIAGPFPEFTCLAGTLVQETYESSPAIRDACAASILGHASSLEPDMRAALEACGRGQEVSAASLARHTQAVIQGAFVVAKAASDPGVARESLDHLAAYLKLLFSRPEPQGTCP
ncbi:TetR/AcrR family transcriptional regulator [Sorangium sp. So ce118]